jgi:hypothetical protein
MRSSSAGLVTPSEVSEAVVGVEGGGRIARA